MSLRELAVEIGSDKETLSKVENGKMQPGIYFLAKICEGLGMTSAEFFKGF